MGIDLRGDGVTTNDPKDPDTGANSLQNYPVVTSAATSGSQTTIKGRLNSTPKRTFTIQFFSSPSVDPSGFGEGKRYLGQKNVTTDADGNASFTFTSTQKVAAGQKVMSTATDENGDTSEFSRARGVV